MSIRAMHVVLNRSGKYRRIDLLVLLALADRADDEGANIYPRIERIASQIRESRLTVIRALARLRQAGDVKWDGVREADGRVRQSGGVGRGQTRRWRIELAALERVSPAIPINVKRASAQSIKGIGETRERVSREAPLRSPVYSYDPSLIHHDPGDENGIRRGSEQNRGGGGRGDPRVGAMLGELAAKLRAGERSGAKGAGARTGLRASGEDAITASQDGARAESGGNREGKDVA